VSELQELVTSWLTELAAVLPFGFAFGVGMVAAVNPCGFAMLPAYLSLYLGAHEEDFGKRLPTTRLLQALLVGVAVSSGFNVLSGDSRSRWEECVMSDPRATHLWDEKRLASRAFAGEVEGASPPVWDAYPALRSRGHVGRRGAPAYELGLHSLRRSGRAQGEHTTALRVRVRRRKR
jgi:hypothetical protein